MVSENADQEGPRVAAPQVQEDKELMSLRKAAEAGNFFAIYQAGYWCDQTKIEPPRWLHEAHRQLADLAPLGGFPKERGRNKNIRDRFRQDTINLARYYMINDMKCHQDEVWDEYEETLRRTDLSEDGRATLIRNAPRNFGKTKDGFFEHASEELRGTAAQGSPDAIRVSYYKVKKDMEDPVASLKYKLMSHHVLRKVGLEELTPSALTRKILPK